MPCGIDRGSRALRPCDPRCCSARLQCRDSLTAALAASRILKKMALEEDQVGDEAEEMRKLANHYERQAVGA